MNIGKKIKNLRSKRGLSQNALAKKAGLRQPTLSRLEAGDASCLRTDNLAKLSSALGVSADFLIGNREQSSPADFLGHDPESDLLLQLFSGLDEATRRQILAYVKFLTQQQEE